MENTMKSVNAAILGTWGKGEKFAGLVNNYKGCRVVCVWDYNPANAESVAERIGCRAEADIDKVMADPEIDGVIIITENFMHAELMLKAAEAGKHIFVEKPMCTDILDAYKVQDAVKRNNVKFFMSDPFVGAACIYSKSLIENKTIGKVLNARIRLCEDFKVTDDVEELRLLTEKTGGGMMSDTGGHALHVAEFLFGMPEEVSAMFSYSSQAASACSREEYVNIIMKYADGMVFNAECSTISPNFTNCIEITGTNGIIVDTGTVRHDHSVRYLRTGEFKTKPFEPAAQISDWTFAGEEDMPEDPDRHVIYWLRMIMEDISREQHENDMKGTSGLGIDKAVELMEMRQAIYESAQTGMSVKIKRRV